MILLVYTRGNKSQANMNPFNYIKYLDHHSYFIHSFTDAVNKLKEHLRDNFGIKHNQNPDFYHEKFEVLGIDDSRKIKDTHSSKSFVDGNKRIYIIEADNITHEAQNSLLKILEEPHIDTHFFIIMPESNLLLPTLKSRLFILNKSSKNIQSLDDARKFLKLSKNDKIKYVDEMAKKIGDEEISKIHAVEFIEKLESILYENGIEKNKKALESVLKVRDYINDRSSSVKQLLEYLVLNID